MTLAILILVCLAGGLEADGSPGDTTPKGPRPPVAIEVAKAVEIAAGDTRPVSFTVTIDEEHRVQANPASNEFLVPLELELDNAPGLRFGPPVYPPGVPYRLEGAEEDLNTYVGKIEITVPLTASADAGAGRTRVSGTLHFQACNKQMCLFPSSISFEFEIVISESE